MELQCYIHITKVKSKLPPGVYINEDLPSEWVEYRILIRPVMKEALKHNKGKVKLQQDKLIINNISYSVHMLHKLPKTLWQNHLVKG